MSITSAGNVASGFLKAVLSTVTSPLPLDVVINYGLCWHRPSSVHVAPSERDAEALAHLERFKVFSEMYMVREFRLVLCAEVFDWDAEEATRALECAVEAERMNGGFDYLAYKPLVTRARLADFEVNTRGEGPAALYAL